MRTINTKLTISITATETSTGKTHIRLVEIVQTIIGLTGARIDLTMAIRATRHSVRTIVAFLLRNEKCTSILRLNYRMGLEPKRTSSMGTIKRVRVLVVNLNKSNS